MIVSINFYRIILSNSGDHDMLVPHIGTYNWINSLNLTIAGSKWDAWYTIGQLAGYKTIYANDNYSLAFATVKVQHTSHTHTH